MIDIQRVTKNYKLFICNYSKFVKITKNLIVSNM